MKIIEAFMIRPTMFMNFLIIASAFFCLPAIATNLEDGIRNFQRHNQWESLEFRQPGYGYFVASRANTNDKNKDANLSLTFEVNGAHCSEHIDLILKLSTPSNESIDKEGLIEFQFDDEPPQVIISKVVAHQGDDFVFIRAADNFGSSGFAKYKSVVVTGRGWGRAEFSLSGFKEAKQRALKFCTAFTDKTK